MNRFHIVLACLSGLALSGCGPLPAPLPVRLDDEQQKSVNESWEKALSPADRFSNQSLLDLLLVTGAYQHGVDKLEFRSEKRFSGGVVVMESRFERSAPERDLFAVTIQDGRGIVIRQERYTRDQIATTSSELGSDCAALQWKRQQGQASPEEIQKLEGYEARLARIEAVFPKLLKEKDERGNKPGAQK